MLDLCLFLPPAQGLLCLGDLVVCVLKSLSEEGGI